MLAQTIGGKEQVVAFASRTLTKAERRYCATRREMLALVWAIRHFRPYLYGKMFTVRTNHNSLKWLQSFRDPEGQLAQWLGILAEYQFTVEHHPGSKHVNADALSIFHVNDVAYRKSWKKLQWKQLSWLLKLSQNTIALKSGAGHLHGQRRNCAHCNKQTLVYTLLSSGLPMTRYQLHSLTRVAMPYKRYGPMQRQ